MINGKPAPAGFPSSQSKSPGLRVCEIRHQTPRGLTPISFQSIRATAADDYPATTAIGVISTMISGTAKLAAVSKVLAGKPLP